jgi:hypothetical protein
MKDLTNIPERFHILFTTDWNKGNDSEMKSTERSILSDLYLEYNKWSVQEAIKSSSTKQKDETITGFLKD